MKDLKDRVVRGGLAKICAQAVTFTLRVGSLMVLARLLEPKDLGWLGWLLRLLASSTFFGILVFPQRLYNA